MTLHHNNHLILMLKTPKLGSVKTRLAASIGNTAATAFYRCAANRLIFELSRDSRWLLRVDDNVVFFSSPESGAEQILTYDLGGCNHAVWQV